MAEDRTERFITTSAKGVKIDYARSSGPNLLSPGDQSARNGGIHASVQPSVALGAIVGNEKLPRSEVISKVWDYIKINNLQNPADKREIMADAKLKKVFGTDRVTMFQMNKHINANVIVVAGRKTATRKKQAP